jgi:hypothetical protein
MAKLQFWFNRSRRFYELCTYYRETYLKDLWTYDKEFQRAWDNRAMYIAAMYIQTLNKLNENG